MLPNNIHLCHRKRDRLAMKYLRSNNYEYIKQVNFTTTIFRQISSTQRLLLLQLRLSRFFQVPTIVGCFLNLIQKVSGS
jgi:uncharacterized tellurite resistance protein B-like protein